VELSPCLDLLFGDDDPQARPETRIRRAANAGFRWVEMWGWSHHDMATVKRALRETGLRLNCLTLEPAVSLVDSRAREPFLESVTRSSRVAADVGCPFVVVLAGDAMPGVSRSAQQLALVDGLLRAAPIAEVSGVTLVLENLNSRIDHVGHYLDTAAEALAVVDAVDHPSVRMLYDLYHSVVMGERPEAVLDASLDRIAHIQVADVPGRHEPGTGAIDWRATLGWLSAHGYQGRLGLEYMPTVGTMQSLEYIRSVMAAVVPTGSSTPT
jgi:hydroxypyruvate isomerase